MIELTKINGKQFILNCDLIQTIEENPDTTITTTSGHKQIVKESVDDIILKVIDFKKKIFGNLSK